MRYLLFATVGTVLFFAVYWFFMRKETRFQMVRWYLLGTLALAMLLPLVRISVTTAVSREVVSAEEVEPLPQQNQVEAVSVEATPSEEVVGAQPQAAPAVSYQVQEPKANQLTNWVEKGLVVVYLLGVAVMLIVLLVRLVDICLKLRSLRAHFTKEDRVAPGAYNCFLCIGYVSVIYGLCFFIIFLLLIILLILLCFFVMLDFFCLYFPRGTYGDFLVFCCV